MALWGGAGAYVRPEEVASRMAIVFSFAGRKCMQRSLGEAFIRCFFGGNFKRGGKMAGDQSKERELDK